MGSLWDKAVAMVLAEAGLAVHIRMTGCAPPVELRSAFQLSQQAAHIAVHIGIALAQIFDQADSVDHG